MTTDLVPMPSNHDAEQAVLGSILFDNASYWRIAATLEPADFYQPRHAVIFATMRRLLNAGTPVDLISLYDAGLERNIPAYESSYLTDLVQCVATSASITYHAKLIKKAAHQRKVITTATKLIDTVNRHPDDTDQLLEHSLQQLSSCLTVDGQVVPMKDAIVGTLDTLSRLSLTPERLIGLPTGFPTLDRQTGGWQPGQCIVMAGAVSMGKSSLLLHSLLASARAGFPVALISLEMGHSQVALRALSAESAIAYYRLRRGLVSTGEAWRTTKEAAERLAALPFYLVEMMDTSMLGILEMGRKLVYQHGIKLLAIDYLGLVKGGNDFEGASENSRLCKIGARQLNIPLIALHQLKREVALRPDKRPILQDLKQTGQTEQDADIVLFLHRDGYYQDSGLTEEPAELIVAKQRDGAVGVLPIVWESQTMSFREPTAESPSV